MKINKITPTGKPSFVTVSETIFQVAENPALVAQAVRVFLSNQRQGTSKVQSRSEVTRTKAKWYKQKGTGRARHGSRNAPIFVGGGVAHGPTGAENWQLSMSQKQKNLALKTALSTQIENIAVSDIPLETEGKTKYAQRFIDLITKIKNDKCLLVYDRQTEAKVWRAFANLPKVLLQSAQSLTTYQVAGADKIIFTTRALVILSDRLDKPASKPAATTEKPKKSSVSEKNSSDIKVIKEEVKAAVKKSKPPATKAVKSLSKKPASKKTTPAKKKTVLKPATKVKK
ncbi:MAG TPA: 50S ribosomal protein L4 [Candidatus Woesebacteria bacterium]|nr:50S ribosomal protein L4 [Candidatus Woesebacteria bacterium]